MNHQTPNHAHEPRSLWRTRYGVGLLVLGAVAAFFLFAEHRAHIFGALPFLLILACPLMHLFMHHAMVLRVITQVPISREPGQKSTARRTREIGHESR
ncbi:hypothetical protein Y695_01455 [Hydrogenophaga sp. T4]|nr:hypothetical protein Y695_01455 [Hydrogenophaga sp. T4]